MFDFGSGSFCVFVPSYQIIFLKKLRELKKNHNINCATDMIKSRLPFIFRSQTTSIFHSNKTKSFFVDTT